METWVMSVAAVWALGLTNTALCSGDLISASRYTSWPFINFQKLIHVCAGVVCMHYICIGS